MAENSTITPIAANEVQCAHSLVSRAFRQALRSGKHANHAEAAWVLWAPSRNEAKRKPFAARAEAAWEALEEDLDAVLDAPSTRDSDAALKRLALIWKAGLACNPEAAHIELSLHARLDRSLYQLQGQGAADLAVQRLLDEAKPILKIFFTLNRFYVAEAFPPKGSPDPFNDQMPCA